MEGRQRRSNICMIGVCEQEKQNNGTEIVFRNIIQENCPEMRS